MVWPRFSLVSHGICCSYCARVPGADHPRRAVALGRCRFEVNCTALGGRQRHVVALVVVQVKKRGARLAQRGNSTLVNFDCALFARSGDFLGALAHRLNREFKPNLRFGSKHLPELLGAAGRLAHRLCVEGLKPLLHVGDEFGHFATDGTHRLIVVLGERAADGREADLGVFASRVELLTKLAGLSDSLVEFRLALDRAEVTEISHRTDASNQRAGLAADLGSGVLLGRVLDRALGIPLGDFAAVLKLVSLGRGFLVADVALDRGFKTDQKARADRGVESERHVSSSPVALRNLCSDPPVPCHRKPAGVVNQRSSCLPVERASATTACLEAGRDRVAAQSRSPLIFSEAVLLSGTTLFAAASKSSVVICRALSANAV